MKLPALLLTGLFAALSSWAAETAPLPASTPWDLKKLSDAPAFEWIDDKSPVRTLTYAGDTFAGMRSKVFAVYATPATISGDESQKGPWPAVVLIHGGGGTAFPEWVTLWAKRGYAAIAMDLGGMTPDLAEPNNAKKRKALPNGGPTQDDTAKFKSITTDDATDDWPYHAVANAVLAHSLIRKMPGVDPERTAVTGISWGGYTTCIVASVDSRFKAAVPVYGCGFLHENSTWLRQFKALGDEYAAKWVKLYDPGSYLASCKVPIFFVNGTNDFAYPLDSYMKSFNSVACEKNIRIEMKMPHSHPEGWKPVEIGAFIDSKLLGKPGLPTVALPTEKDGTAFATVQGGKAKAGTLEFTKAEGPINKLEWEKTPVTPGADGTLSAPLPDGVRIYYFTATTESGMTVSSPVIIKK